MTPISQVKPVSTIEMHNDIAILITPIMNGARQTGTRFSFNVNGLRRQTFSLDAAKAMINEILGMPSPAETNPLVEVAPLARTHKAMRGGIGDPKSATPFG